jgi:hypothetical protein
LPPAPGLLSTTTVQPSVWLSLSATMRAMMSVPPAGGNGTMSLIGLAGYVCAMAPPATAAAATAASSPRLIALIVIFRMSRLLERPGPSDGP